MENPNEVVVKPSTALVPTTREETKALVISAVRNILTGTGKNLGVSRNWLVRHAEKLDLTQDEVESFVAIRTEHGALLPHAVKFLYQGLTVEDVENCYRVNREMAMNGEQVASVKKISKLIRTFSEADPSYECLAETISEAHDLVSDRYFWVRYADQTITVLCAVAEKYECATIEAALSMIESRQPKWDGVVNDDDEDEVEHRREDYEQRRESR